MTRALSGLLAHHLIPLRASCCRLHEGVTKEIDRQMLKVDASVRQGAAVHHLPHYMGLCAAWMPQDVLPNWNSKLPVTRTFPLAMAIDPAGPFFLEFEVITANFSDGCLKVGLIDSSSSLGSVTGRDLTNENRGSYALECYPFGHTEACVKAHRHVNLHRPEARAHLKKKKVACLPLGDLAMPGDEPHRIGLWLENHAISFFLAASQDEWYSSGPLCDNISCQITPCVFLDRFVGDARVRFTGLQQQPPALKSKRSLLDPLCCCYCDYQYS